jgi:hypothetical protein
MSGPGDGGRSGVRSRTGFLISLSTEMPPVDRLRRRRRTKKNTTNNSVISTQPAIMPAIKMVVNWSKPAPAAELLADADSDDEERNDDDAPREGDDNVTRAPVEADVVVAAAVVCVVVGRRSHAAGDVQCQPCDKSKSSNSISNASRSGSAQTSARTHVPSCCGAATARHAWTTQHLQEFQTQLRHANHLENLHCLVLPQSSWSMPANATPEHKRRVGRAAANGTPPF